MLEVMVALGIMSVSMGLVFAMQLRQQDAQAGVREADNLQSFQQAAAQYFMANRNAIIDAAGATAASDPKVQEHCVIKVTNPSATINPGTTPGGAGPNGTLAWSGGAAIGAGKKTCTIDASLLRAKGAWPAGIHIAQRDDGMGQWRYVAIFKRVREPGPDKVLNNADDVLGKNVEMLVLRMPESGTLPTMPNTVWRSDQSRVERTITAMRTMGQSGGYMPIGNTGSCVVTNTTVQVCGPGWNANLNDWIDVSQLNYLKARLPAS